jgi:hypothetical protein
MHRHKTHTVTIGNGTKVGPVRVSKLPSLPIYQQNKQIKEKLEKSSQKNAYSPLLFLGTFFLFGKFCDNSIIDYACFCESLGIWLFVDFV